MKISQLKEYIQMYDTQKGFIGVFFARVSNEGMVLQTLKRTILQQENSLGVAQAADVNLRLADFLQANDFPADYLPRSAAGKQLFQHWREADQRLAEIMARISNPNFFLALPFSIPQIPVPAVSLRPVTLQTTSSVEQILSMIPSSFLSIQHIHFSGNRAIVTPWVEDPVEPPSPNTYRR